MHSLRVTQVLEAGMSLFSCLTLPAGAVLSAVRPARSDGEYPGCNLSRKVLVEHAYCRHSRFRKALARLIHTLQRRGRKEQIIKGGCPLCGLLPRGSAGVVYVLSIRFANGEYHEYYFRGQPEKECYRVSDGVLNIYLTGITIAYPLDVITAVTFGPQLISGDPPEVVEAQRIITGKYHHQ